MRAEEDGAGWVSPEKIDAAMDTEGVLLLGWLAGVVSSSFFPTAASSMGFLLAEKGWFRAAGGSISLSLGFGGDRLPGFSSSTTTQEVSCSRVARIKGWKFEGSNLDSKKIGLKPFSFIKLQGAGVSYKPAECLKARSQVTPRYLELNFRVARDDPARRPKRLAWMTPTG